MIPIKDMNPTRRFSYLTAIIIILNVYVFVLQLSLEGDEQEFFYFNHSVIPKCFIASFQGADAYDSAIEETKSALAKAMFRRELLSKYQGRLMRTDRLRQMESEIRDIVDEKVQRGVFGLKGLPAEIWSLFSSMFIHGSIMHLIGNMWFLWIFGNNIEDVLGVFKFILFYLVCGIFAGFGHIILSMDSLIPTIGASGAISGVLGAYLLFFPHARILTFIPIGWFLWMEDLPAYIFLGYWILIQILFASFSNPLLRGGGGVAWFAHIAGFAAGVLFVIFFERRKAVLLGQKEGESVVRIVNKDEEEDDEFSD